MKSNGEISKKTLAALDAYDEFKRDLLDLEELTEKARIDREAYKLALENLKTLRQLENGVVIR